MEKFILSLDQGTGSSRALLINREGEVHGLGKKELPQYYPHKDWVEQNPDEIWESQKQSIQIALQDSGIGPEQIHAIGITNQRETTIVWDKNTGKPVYPAIVWQDKRTAHMCEQIKKKGWSKYIRKATGLFIDSYFSATKISWILNNVENAREKAEQGELLFGTVDTWLIWNLSQGQLHITDYTNASRTMLFNINTLEWDHKLLDYFNIPVNMLPELTESSEIVGVANTGVFNGLQIPIAGIAGDQQAALFGQAGFESGVVKNTYGTGCFMLMNTGNKKVKSKHGLLTTLSCQTKHGQPAFALEGAVFIAGAAIKWLRDSLQLVDNASATEQIAESISNTSGVYVVPAFSGLGAPYWDMYARGGIFGLSQDTCKEHIIKATLESLAYQSKDVIDAMEKDAKLKIQSLNVDGGASANNYLMQFQANLVNANVQRPDNLETTAMGAAYLAGLATGYWNSTGDLVNIRNIDRTFFPGMDESTRSKLLKGWKKAVTRTMDWEK